MKIITHCLNTSLLFYSSLNSTFRIYVLDLVLVKLEEDTIAAYLTAEVDQEHYHQIETNALFNYKLETCIRPSLVPFLSEKAVQLKLSLQPNLLSKLIKYLPNSDEVVTAVFSLIQEQPDNPLFDTENWLLLSAKQTCEDGERGYRTLWDYLSPTALAQASENGVEDPTTYALISFFKDWTSSHLSTDLEQTASDLLKNLETTFTEFSNTNLADIEKLFTDFKQEAETQWQASSLKTTLLDQVIRFFTTEDWQFTKLQGEPTLAMAFQGKQSRWNCYACIREAQQQLTFYSVCPIAIPEPQRSPIAEFLTRANYGMILGNFELDLDDGEIRYKTSIDVTNSALTPALIQSIVYTNVMTMDQYFPSIQAVIDGVGAIDALRQVEGQPEVPASD